MRTLHRLPFVFALLALAFAPLAASPAQAATDPAASQVESFYGVLLDTMKQGPSLGVKGRFHKLSPAVERAFDLPTMARFAVGPAWNGFSAAQQRSVIDAFTQLSVASYAHNFSKFDGERFDVDPNVQTRGPDKVVQTHLIRTHDSPISLAYRMRQSGDSWKIIDVYSGAISQLTTKRSDFAAPIASGGAPGLISHLNTLSQNLMK
jgi:phospholipid transport system substrate-binding protein